MKPTRHPIGNRRIELQPERVHDTYALRGKLASPAVCGECQAVYTAGRWQWGAVPAGAHAAVCPACARARDRLPAGYVRIDGPFAAEHRETLLQLVRNRAERERAEHPLERVIAIEPHPDHVMVTTTGVHVARALGDALADAYQGELDYHYNDAEPLLRVHWSR